MSADFEPQRKVYLLDIPNAKFTQRRDMQFERMVDGGIGAFLASNGYVYMCNGC